MMVMMMMRWGDNIQMFRISGYWPVRMCLVRVSVCVCVFERGTGKEFNLVAAFKVLSN